MEKEKEKNNIFWFLIAGQTAKLVHGLLPVTHLMTDNKNAWS